MTGVMPSRAALACVLAWTLVGCGAWPPPRRSTGKPDTAPSDTFAVMARAAMERWDAGDEAQAARLTAGTLFEALRRRPEGPWAARVHGLVDSLGILAEVAGLDQIALVNVRSRMNPEGDSWPWLMWREADGAHEQGVEGAGLSLGTLVTRGFNGGLATDSAQVASLWSRRGAVGSLPVLLVWRHTTGARWDLQQMLPGDSLGGTGEAEFVRTDGGMALETRTFMPTAGFDECPTCPHIHRERRYVWSAAGFTKVEDRPVPTSYSTFAAFIQALQAGDQVRASLLVVDPMLVDFARRFAWDDAGRGLWRAEPGTSDASPEMVFFRGSSEAYRVAFEARENDWRIAGFEPTTRAID